MKNIFKVVDEDGSGGISFEEYKKSFLGQKFTEEQARENFAKMDLDGNNIIDYDEFSKFHQNASPEDFQISPQDMLSVEAKR
jgi:Ca2+-binding EF-hand superfamily protein